MTPHARYNPEEACGVTAQQHLAHAWAHLLEAASAARQAGVDEETARIIERQAAQVEALHERVGDQARQAA